MPTSTKASSLLHPIFVVSFNVKQVVSSLFSHVFLLRIGVRPFAFFHTFSTFAGGEGSCLQTGNKTQLISFPS